MAKDAEALIAQVKRQHPAMEKGMPEVMEHFRAMMQAVPARRERRALAQDEGTRDAGDLDRHPVRLLHRVPRGELPQGRRDTRGDYGSVRGGDRDGRRSVVHLYGDGVGRGGCAEQGEMPKFTRLWRARNPNDESMAKSALVACGPLWGRTNKQQFSISPASAVRENGIIGGTGGRKGGIVRRASQSPLLGSADMAEEVDRKNQEPHPGPPARRGRPGTPLRKSWEEPP